MHVRRSEVQSELRRHLWRVLLLNVLPLVFGCLHGRFFHRIRNHRRQGRVDRVQVVALGRAGVLLCLRIKHLLSRDGIWRSQHCNGRLGRHQRTNNWRAVFHRQKARGLFAGTTDQGYDRGRDPSDLRRVMILRRRMNMIRGTNGLAVFASGSVKP